MRLSTTKEMQNVLLEDYRVVSQIWDKNKYYYCLTGGSVLGAVRHKGFIPWDDDFDVGLARNDYEDFIANSAKELPDYLCLYLRKKTQQYVVLDTRYEIEYDQKNQDALYDEDLKIANPALDIQIFDGTPNNLIHRKLYCLHVMALRVRIKISDPDKIHQEKWRPKWENILIAIIKALKRKNKKGVEKLIKKYNRLIKRYSFENSVYIADFVGKYHMKDVYPKRWWDPITLFAFEDIEVPIPNGYHNYLSQIYGDYMTMPKEAEKVQHTKRAV